MKQHNSPFPGVGASSILMIFVMLCLTTFGVLSYVTADADRKISTKNAESVENYYKAVSAAQAKLQKIDAELLRAQYDAKRIAKDPIYLGLMSDSVYSENKDSLAEIDALLKSGASPDEKRSGCYRLFASARLARLPGVTLLAASGTPGASFTEKVDENRSLSVTLITEPYGGNARYRITEQKLLNNRSSEGESMGDGEPIQLWPGPSNSATGNP